ncbi:MAG: hypothetical protein L6R35_006059, partial [Caloplaca aegaea]
MRDLLQREDTDNDGLITIDDQGPKDFPLGNYSTQHETDFTVQGVYQLSCLLQELFLAQKRGLGTVTIRRTQLEEDPVHRLTRLIKTSWWDNLTRRIDADGIERAAPDPKPTMKGAPRIYIPPEAPEQHAYYTAISKERPGLRLDVQWLPKGEMTAEYIKGINHEPGILALEMEAKLDQPEGKGITKQLKGCPFIVPGDQFNELYNWDACFCALGMLDTHLPVVKGIIKNFIFEIKHYGKVLNANRSYYLGRSQPPLLTWLALKTFSAMKHQPDALDILKSAILAARKEYHAWWTSRPRLDEESGLSRYRPIGKGSPPECGAEVFSHVFTPYAKKYGMTVEETCTAYNDGTLVEPELDVFFDHDRAVRENGHDTSNRVEDLCADLATVDLNCLLYRIEEDIAIATQTHFDDSLTIPAEFCAPGDQPNTIESSNIWFERAQKRKDLINKYCWNEEKGMYLDYNTVTKQQSTFEGVTCLWPLWCGIASDKQAARLVKDAIPTFERVGGLASTSEETRGTVSEVNPQKQWDYPNGWAPHQILAWDGLRRYGYFDESARLNYRWLHLLTECFRNWNGSVVEKYNVTDLKRPHKVDAEYGNQGRNFKYAPQEGFGWTNASYIYGLSLATTRRLLVVPTADAPTPVRKSNDDALRNIFDSQSFWRDFRDTHHSTTLPPKGLFENRYLTKPDGFIEFARTTAEKCQHLVARVVGASSLEEQRLIPKVLDRLSDSLCRVLDIADFVRATHPDAGFREAATDAYSMLYEFMNVLNTTPDLKTRLENAVNDRNVSAWWTDEEKMVAQMLLKDFAKSAIEASDEKRQAFVELSTRVRQLGTEFLEGIRPESATISFSNRQLKGVDPRVLQNASKRHFTGFSIPTFGPVAFAALISMEDESARRDLYVAMNTSPDAQVQTLEDFLKTRARVANLAGFGSFAEMNLTDKMAKTPVAVNSFLESLSRDNKSHVQLEVDEMLSLKKLDTGDGASSVQIEPWDTDYYKARLVDKYRSRSRRPDFMSAYFSLGTVMQGLSRLFTHLYGVRFVPAAIAPGEAWDPDVRRLDVIDETEGRIAVLYCDLFARPEKSPNPTHFTLRCSRRIDQSEIEEASSLYPNLDPRKTVNDGMAISYDLATDTTYQLPTIAL